MLNAFNDFVGPLLGLGTQPKDLTFVQISLRGVIVFLASLIMVRLSKKRSLSKRTAFDAILIVILASVLSRAINGTAAFFASIGGGLTLVALHRFVGWLGCFWPGFGGLIKGSSEVIVKDGRPVAPVMRRNHISRDDLEEDLRLDAETEDLSRIRLARIERSGEISFFKKEG